MDANSLDMIIKVAQVLSSAAVIIGVLFAIFTFISKNDKQDKDIKKIKCEQKVLVVGLRACLDGLHQQGCNGRVSEGIDMLDDYLNSAAHDD